MSQSYDYTGFRKHQREVSQQLRRNLERIDTTDPRKTYEGLTYATESFVAQQRDISIDESQAILEKIKKLYNTFSRRNRKSFTENPVEHKYETSLKKQIAYAAERLVERCIEDSEKNPGKTRKDMAYAIEIMNENTDAMNLANAKKYLAVINQKKNRDQKTDKIEEEIKKRNALEGGLERRLFGYISIISMAAGLIFLSPNITGNIIGNPSSISLNMLGPSLLVIGLITGYFWLKKH